MATAADHVARKLAALWPEAADRQRAHDLLEGYGTEPYEREAPRVRLAVLKLCEGRLEKLPELIAAAKTDYRDVLMWAESPGEGQALWALRPDLSEEERQRLERLRASDRQSYREWLDE